MVSKRQLQFKHAVTGDFPMITFSFDADLEGFTVTSLYELYILVRDPEGVLYCASVDDAFAEDLFALGKREGRLSGDLLLLINDGNLWQLELGTDKWTFVMGAEEYPRLFAAVMGPFDPSFTFPYAICGEKDAFFVPGGKASFEGRIEKIVFRRDSSYTLVNGKVVKDRDQVIFGYEDVSNVAVGDDDVYVCVHGDWVILQEDDVRYSRCTQAPRLCAEITDQGDIKEAWRQGRQELPCAGGGRRPALLID